MNKEEIQNRIEELTFEMEKINPESSEAEKSHFLSVINEILEIDPLHVDALTLKAMFYQIIEEYDSAIEIYKQILQITPDDKYAKDSIADCEKFKNWDNEKIEFNTKTSYDKPKGPSFIEKVPCELIFGVKLVIVLGILAIFSQSALTSVSDSKMAQLSIKSPNFKSIRVNYPSEYNFLSKESIYKTRKKYVQRSTFANENYEPNSAVFGSIVSGKPWWGLITCVDYEYQGDYHERIEGPSKVSVQMNNPDALVGISLPYTTWNFSENQYYCNAEYSKFIPSSIKYSEKDKMIVSTYSLERNFLNLRANISGKSHRYPLQLSGLNARDFGYDYVYAIDTKNIKYMYSSNNISEGVKSFKDYVHLGGSCKYEGGCNNISPLQQDKMIKITELPAEITMKLWKEKPNNEFQKADMYYKIIFEEIR